MAVGYALFSENITINGTATAKGSFDISYTCELATEEISFSDGSGQSEVFDATIGATGTCSISGQTITTTSTLSKPSDNAVFKVTLTNNGSIPAVLKTVDSSNNVADDFSSAGDRYYYDSTNFLFAYYGFAKGGSAFSDGELSISGDSYVENEKIILQPNETLTLVISNMWADSSMFDVDQPSLPENGVTMNYNITLGFEQVTNE